MSKTQLANCESLSESEIVIKHDRLVHSLARRFRAADVADLVQIGRLALLEAARGWRGESQFWTYARRAVLGAMIDYVTRECQQPQTQWIPSDGDFPEDLEPRDVSIEPAPDARLEIVERLSVLTEVQREIVILHVRDGLGFEALAERTHRSKSDVHRIFESALETLRERARIQ